MTAERRAGPVGAIGTVSRVTSWFDKTNVSLYILAKYVNEIQKWLMTNAMGPVGTQCAACA